MYSLSKTSYTGFANGKAIRTAYTGLHAFTVNFLGLLVLGKR